MGFPGSSGSPVIWDYLVFVHIIVPLIKRRHFDEALVYMPQSYFVNSHRSVIRGGQGVGMIVLEATIGEGERGLLHSKYRGSGGKIVIF